MSRNKKYLETLKHILGEDLYSIVNETFAGMRITFPKTTDYYEKEERNTFIMSDFRNGSSVQDLVKKYQLSESQIYKIINDFLISGH